MKKESFKLKGFNKGERSNPLPMVDTIKKGLAIAKGCGCKDDDDDND